MKPAHADIHAVQAIINRLSTKLHRQLLAVNNTEAELALWRDQLQQLEAETKPATTKK